MGRLANYLIFLSVILLLFHFAGIIDTGVLSYILAVIQDPSNFGNFSYFTTMNLALAGAAAGGAIALGVFTRSSPEFYIILPIAVMFFTITSDFVVLYQKLALIDTNLALLIISPLLIVFILTVVEWARGRD